MKRISNHDLEYHETIIALANAIERRAKILQTTTEDNEIKLALSEIEQFSLSIKNRQQKRLKEQKSNE